LILTDAGPLVALANRREPAYARCIDALARVSLPLVTTWPAFTEAMYLLRQALGWPGQNALWMMVERGDLQIVEMSAVTPERMHVLMRQYRDLPMDLADASLVAYAEVHGLDRVFSLDQDFHVYRLPRGRAFTVIP
jgi:uncharacterized protein